MKKQLFWKNKGYKKGKPLRGIIECPYLIVGGGIAGLTAAYFLLERGVSPHDVVIVERNIVGNGSTGHSAGMLIPEPENEQNLWWGAYKKKYGAKNTKLYRKANRDALKTVEKLITLGKIRCDARLGDFLILACTPTAHARLMQDSLARQSFGEKAPVLSGRALQKEIATPLFQFAERSLQGLSVNPLALAQGIATYLRKQGVRVYEDTPIHSTYKNTARTSHGAIEYKTILYAQGTGAESSHLQNFITTIGVTTPLSKTQLMKLNLLDKDMFIDEEGAHSFHYGKITGDNRLLVGYGDVRTKENTSTISLHTPHIRNISTFLTKAFAGSLKIEYAWSGVYALSKGMLPLVSIRKNVATVNGAGIQLGSIAATHYVITKLFNKKHPLDDLFTSH